MDNKQIEEMAKVIKPILENRVDIGFIPDLAKPIAKELLKHYQPKLPEGSVVLSKEEYESLQIVKDFNYGYHEGEKNMEAYYQNIKLPDVRNQARKQAVKEVLERVNKEIDEIINTMYRMRIDGVAPYCLIKDRIDKIAKEMGVEI